MSFWTALGIGMKLGGGALSISEILKQGKEEKRQAYYMAAEKIRRASFLSRIAVEKKHELLREAEQRAGTTRARIAKAGVRATGSAAKQLEKPFAEMRRRGELIGLETSYQMKSLYDEAEEWRRSGKIALRQAKMRAWAEGLGAGFGAYKKFKKLG